VMPFWPARPGWMSGRRCDWRLRVCYGFLAAVPVGRRPGNIRAWGTPWIRGRERQGSRDLTSCVALSGLIRICLFTQGVALG
jgi:hypothetical protein